MFRVAQVAAFTSGEVVDAPNRLGGLRITDNRRNRITAPGLFGYAVIAVMGYSIPTVPVLYLPILGHAPEPLLDGVARLAKNVGHFARTQKLVGLLQHAKDLLALLAHAILFGIPDYRPAGRLRIPLQGVLGGLFYIAAVHVQHGVG